jgi:hypothetical protein
MTQAQLEQILDASKPTPAMYLSGGVEWTQSLAACLLVSLGLRFDALGVLAIPALVSGVDLVGLLNPSLSVVSTSFLAVRE